MLDHIGYAVSDYQKSKEFYKQTLKAINYELIAEFGEEAAGFGINQKPDFWLANGKDEKSGGVHIAFACESHEQVDEFYKAAIAAGGKDNGAPGIREQYHPNYYGAFILDFDGNNVEAVCHKPYPPVNI